MTERGKPLMVELTVKQRATIESKAAIEGVSMRELVIRAIDAYQPMSHEDRMRQLEELEMRIAELERKAASKDGI